MNIRPPFFRWVLFCHEQKGLNDKIRSIKGNHASDTKADKINDEELFNIPDFSYTRFTHSENADGAFNPALDRQTYPDNLPEDNVEAALTLMKQSLKMSNNKKINIFFKVSVLIKSPKCLLIRRTNQNDCFGLHLIVNKKLLLFPSAIKLILVIRSAFCIKICLKHIIVAKNDFQRQLTRFGHPVPINLYNYIGFTVSLPKFHLHFKRMCCIKHFIRGVAQPGRVLGLGPRCRMFESCRPDHSKKARFHIVFFL